MSYSKIYVCFLILMSLGLSTLQAENLPDEINYPHYQRIYDSSQSRATNQRQEVSRLQNDISNTEQNIRRVEESIVQHNSQIENNQREINDLYYRNGRLGEQINQLVSINRSLEQEIYQLDQRLQRKLVQANRTRRTLREEKRKLDQIAPNLNRLKEKLKVERRKVRAKETEVATLPIHNFENLCLLIYSIYTFLDAIFSFLVFRYHERPFNLQTPFKMISIFVISYLTIT